MNIHGSTSEVECTDSPSTPSHVSLLFSESAYFHRHFSFLLFVSIILNPLYKQRSASSLVNALLHCWFTILFSLVIFTACTRARGCVCMCVCVLTIHCKNGVRFLLSLPPPDLHLDFAFLFKPLHFACHAVIRARVLEKRLFKGSKY